ncbi:MAG TPA: putative sulfate exporter family transporter [Candidatus Kapabacteria bacterium]|nr:putative sulfate exporter family transporter [Candidatus Kapabacteria bacterium]
MNKSIQQLVFIVALVLCFFPFVSPPIALAMGLLLALTLGHPFVKYNSKATKILLQVSVVGLGFGMNLGSVIAAGQTGFLFTVVTIFGTLTLGYFVGQWLGLTRKLAHLISSGTAICGGSAIAAVGPVLEADAHEMSVSLGTVFILNSIALLLFPVIGHALNMTQQQFGIWAAIAIHDTSSVVGAAAKYGSQALEVATTVKLARALWIIPVALLTSFLFKKSTKKLSIPYFIFLFIIASVLRTYVGAIADISGSIVTSAKIGLTITLFLIGAGLSRTTLKAVGYKPLLFGMILWIVISVTSLIVVTNTI